MVTFCIPLMSSFMRENLSMNTSKKKEDKEKVLKGKNLNKKI